MTENNERGAKYSFRRTKTGGAVAMLLLGIGAGGLAWETMPEPVDPGTIQHGPARSCRVDVPASLRDEGAALRRVRQALHAQDCHGGAWLEVRGLPVHYEPGGITPLPDWTAALCGPGSRWEEADNGQAAAFNCVLSDAAGS